MTALWLQRSRHSWPWLLSSTQWRVATGPERQTVSFRTTKLAWTLVRTWTKWGLFSLFPKVGPHSGGGEGAGNQDRRNTSLRANRSQGQERKPGAWSCFGVTVTLHLLLTIRLLFLPQEEWKWDEATLCNTSLSGKNVDRRSYLKCRDGK